MEKHLEHFGALRQQRKLDQALKCLCAALAPCRVTLGKRKALRCMPMSR